MSRFDNDVIEIPTKWWHVVLIFVAILIIVLVGGAVVHILLFR